MYGQLNKLGVAASVLGLVSAFPQAVPYSDGTCQNPISSYTYVNSNKNGNGSTIQSQPFATGKGVSANHDGTWSFETYNNIRFSNLSSSSTSLSQGVFWKMEQLDPGCRVLFMRPFDNQDTVPGSVILNAGDPDACYFSDPKGKMQVSFCCGTDDCAAFNVGESSLNTRAELPKNYQQTSGANNGPSSSIAKTFLGKIPGKNNNQKRGPQPKSSKKARDVSASGSIAARALAQAKRDGPKTCGATDTDCFNREWAKCHVKVTGQPISTPGKQMSVSQWMDCTSSLSDCKVTTTHTHTYSYEVSVSQSQSDTTGTSSSQSSSQTNTNTMEVTNTDGWSLDVSVGIGFGPFSASTDAGTSHSTTTDNTNTQTNTEEQSSSQSFSQTVANTTGHAVTNAQGESVSQEYPIIAGGYGILTFTPLYDCFPVEVDCGEGHYFEWKEDNGDQLRGIRYLETKICSPSTVNNQVQGLREVLYSNRS